MATLWITETDAIGKTSLDQPVPVASLVGATTQTVAFTTSAESAALSKRFGRVYADAACHLAYGSAPTATTGDLPLPASKEEWFMVEPGMKIAAILAA